MLNLTLNPSSIVMTLLNGGAFKEFTLFASMHSLGRGESKVRRSIMPMTIKHVTNALLRVEAGTCMTSSSTR